MKPPKNCPICGRSDTWIRINSYHDGYSVVKGFLGHILFSRYIGTLAGFLGKKHQVYLCKNCGFQQTYSR